MERADSVSMNYSIAIDFLKNCDPILGRLIDRVGVCQLDRHQLEGDLFFCLCRSILHQQLSTKVAKVIHQRFLQLYPESKFPSAPDVLNTPDEVLRCAGISRPKISYLKDLAVSEAAKFLLVYSSGCRNRSDHPQFRFNWTLDKREYASRLCSAK